MRPVLQLPKYFSIILLIAVTVVVPADISSSAPKSTTSPNDVICKRIIKADVVALEQAYLLNRFASYVPAGMLFALRSDVVSTDGEAAALLPGRVQLKPTKRPRPLVLRANEGDCIDVKFTNLLADVQEAEGGIPRENEGRLPAHVDGLPGTSSSSVVPATKVSVDMPRTREASFHITGLSMSPITPDQCPRDVACGGDGSNVGLTEQQGIIFNPATSSDVRKTYDVGSLARPGKTVITRWHAKTEGAYFAYSTAAPVGGEGDGGQIGLGLFAAVNVEPQNSRWYRSQVTNEELIQVSGNPGAGQHPYRAIDYDHEISAGGHQRPMLAMLDRENNIVHSDLNAIVVLDDRKRGQESTGCTGAAFGSSCNRPFREFTVIFHDEVHAQQAFSELADENSPLSQIRDGMGINYGVSSMGALMMGTPQFRKTGPAKECPECRAEEFFLSSWANGDPALILAYDKSGVPTGARYPDDPSNVHHSYLGDPVRFRNIHAGPKETHVFHLHAHQWVQDSSSPTASYLDSQTISPGATFSYNIEFGGSGNRNYTPGDSIFHCHLYPHFAQGMWELWRVHDAFVDGKPGLFNPEKAAGPQNDPTGMNLPDAEIDGGTASPAVVPIPSLALAPMPTEAFRGYPFYIPGSPGHRPPQPVLDMDVIDKNWVDMTQEPHPDSIVNGGLPRHVVVGGELATNLSRALEKGGEAAQVIAQRVAKQDPPALSTLAKEWGALTIKPLKHSGELSELAAMSFHEGALAGPGLIPVAVSGADRPHPGWWPGSRAYRTDNAATTPIQRPVTGKPLFFVNARPRAPGAPYANPCPVDAPERDYRAAFIQTELTYNKHGWFDPQGRIIVLENDIKDIIDPSKRTRLPEPLFFRANSGECINFKSSNFVPSALNVDDFQIYTPTDTIGQHIHLVKFDVTSSDGSGNGFNYEDATFSPEEVRERIFAWNRSHPGTKLKPQPHPLFRQGGDIFQAAGGDINHPVYGALLKRGLCPAQNGESNEAYEDKLRLEHPFCGAQRTTQRWWADPILNPLSGKDQTLRTVFTHDHLGPSSHQQHGLYAGLVIEPANSVWTRLGSSITTVDLLATKNPDALNCALAARDAARSSICDRIIGGSNLALKTAPSLLKPGNEIEGTIEPRPPLKLRPDGGPTATMANIIAPMCIGDSDSHPFQPDEGLNRPRRACPSVRSTGDTRREFGLAMADFGIAYNMALEPINPEPRGDSMLRDNSAIRFGRRHVATTPARPLGISSEDPGSQYFNYRHEPLALRLSESKVDFSLGGWNYRQARTRANLSAPCASVDQDCIGDPANGFSTAVHAKRDESLAKHPMAASVMASTRELVSGTPSAAKLDKVLGDVETWRRDFNCMLYSTALMNVEHGCAERLMGPETRLEPWRVFGDPATPILPAYEGDAVQIRLIQGAQEAQHIFTMNGVKWHRLPGSNAHKDANDSGFVNTQTLGISEHFEFDVNVSPFNASHTDYLYFGSSVDQLWDGLWGVLRSFPPPREQSVTSKVTTSTGPVQFTPSEFLAPIQPPPPVRLGDVRNVCPEVGGDKAKRQHRNFDVSAVKVCDLFNNCGSASPGAIEYSSRYGIKDEKAIIYVLEEEAFNCKDENTCNVHAAEWQRRKNSTTLQQLRSEFAVGRPLEPLVLRASAGQCLHVNLRNLVPNWLDDGPTPGADGPNEVSEARAYHNFLPMITDGFNINQIRMSSTVGLSAPRVAQLPTRADGSNVGLNGAVVAAAPDSNLPGSPFDLPASSFPRQGSLVPPCSGSPVLDGFNETRCKLHMVWSATDYRFEGKVPYLPVEFGALPLRSFGDPIKHPAHGLIGALVIGPEGSEVCATNRFARSPLRLPDGQTKPVPAGASAEVCKADGRRYVDHVLIMQDAVSATRGGLPVSNLAGAEEPDDYGMKAINYRTEPLWARRGNEPSVQFSERNDFDYGSVLSSAWSTDESGFRCKAGILPLLSKKYPCDPETPVLEASPGETVRLNIVHAGGHTRQQGLALSGHAWNPYPWSANSRVFDPALGSSIRQGVYNGFGPMMGISLEVVAGGDAKMPMDYLFRSQSSFLFDGGLWGILRVQQKTTSPIRPGSKKP